MYFDIAPLSRGERPRRGFGSYIRTGEIARKTAQSRESWVAWRFGGTTGVWGRQAFSPPALLEVAGMTDQIAHILILVFPAAIVLGLVAVMRTGRGGFANRGERCSPPTQTPSLR